jgi:hypothetical protein
MGRRLMHEPCKHLADACPVAVERPSHCASESLLEVVESLSLLRQFHTGVRDLQA